MARPTIRTPHRRLAGDGEPCLVPEERLKWGAGTDLNQSGMPEFCGRCVSGVGGRAPADHADGRRTERTRPAPLPAAPSMQWT